VHLPHDGPRAGLPSSSAEHSFQAPPAFVVLPSPARRPGPYPASATKTPFCSSLDRAEANFSAVNVACLDTVADEELAEVPVCFADGRNDRDVEDEDHRVDDTLATPSRAPRRVLSTADWPFQIQTRSPIRVVNASKRYPAESSASASLEPSAKFASVAYELRRKSTIAALTSAARSCWVQ